MNENAKKFREFFKKQLEIREEMREYIREHGTIKGYNNPDAHFVDPFNFDDLNKDDSGRNN